MMNRASTGTTVGLLSALLVASAGLTAPVQALAPASPVVAAQGARVDVGNVDATDRAQVIATYANTYMPAYNTTFAWTGGNVDTCQPGTPSTGILDASLTATNYVRDLAGVPPVTVDPAKNVMAQQAALMMEANNTLTHTPSTNMRCYTADGATAAGKSNLALGYTGVHSVGGYMSDTGSNNTYAGHRRWILDPGVKTVGFGITPRANAMHVVGSDYEWDAGTTGVAWPTAGYFPEGLYPGADEWSSANWDRGTAPERWTYTTYDNTNFDNVTVAVTQTAPTVRALTVNIEDSDTGHLVFAPSGVTLPSEADNRDVTYQVTINGLATDDGAALPAVTYTTTLVPSTNTTIEETDDPTVTIGTVTIKGTPKVGKRLRAKVTGFTPTPSRITYKWLRNGKTIKSATNRSYTVKRADKNHKIRVRVTVSQPSAGKTSQTSSPVKVRR